VYICMATAFFSENDVLQTLVCWLGLGMHRKNQFSVQMENLKAPLSNTIVVILAMFRFAPYLISLVQHTCLPPKMF